MQGDRRVGLFSSSRRGPEYEIVAIAKFKRKLRAEEGTGADLQIGRDRIVRGSWVGTAGGNQRDHN